VASIYRKDESGRSVALGRAPGGGAVGVLLGYPIGGFLYQLSGKTVHLLGLLEHFSYRIAVDTS